MPNLFRFGQTPFILLLFAEVAGALPFLGFLTCPSSVHQADFSHSFSFLARLPLLRSTVLACLSLTSVHDFLLFLHKKKKKTCKALPTRTARRSTTMDYVDDAIVMVVLQNNHIISQFLVQRTGNFTVPKRVVESLLVFFFRSHSQSYIPTDGGGSVDGELQRTTTIGMGTNSETFKMFKSS